MLRAHVIAAMLAGWSLGAGAQPLEFKGLKFDEASSEEVRIELVNSGYIKTWNCHQRAPTHTYCRATGVTFAARPAEIGFTFLDDKLAGYTVSFDATDFNHVIKALSERHGAPRIALSKQTTLGGLKVEQAIATWPSRAGEQLLAMRYSDTVTTGLLVLANKAAQAAEAALLQQDAVKAKKDI